jgi:serine protease
VDIAAPGEGIISTNNAGKTTPTTDILATGDGTSFATPQVSGVVALMLASNPNLKNNTLATGTVAAAIENNLKASVRAFPVIQAYGAGLLDAYQALSAVQAKPTANAGADQSVAGNTVVTLDASASTNGAYGTPTLAKYVWTQTAGDTVSLGDSLTAKASFTIPNVANKSYSFNVTVTNDVGFSSTDDVMVTATSVSPVSPSPSSGGGGSESWLGLGLLSLLALYRFKTRQ